MSATFLSCEPQKVDPISLAEVEAAEKAWVDALVDISTTFDNSGIEAARSKASGVLDAAYGYADGPVLFKPTLAKQPQAFRPTRQGALAYFVGHDPEFPNDAGFALKHWRSGAFENIAVISHGDMAVAMCHVVLTDRDGNTTAVDKTWTYRRDASGGLRIVGHHSSLAVTA